MRTLPLLVPFIAVFAIAIAAPAQAESERYAVVVGHNSGSSEERRLRYAESDAQRFADLLGDIGGVPSENQVILLGKTADDVRRAMVATNERIRATRHTADAVMFVYYSGHGDADALHLGGTLLPLSELESLVRGSPAGVRVLVIDSCRSGSITRVKGGVPARPLALATSSPLLGEGMIVLTASTLSEDAHEADSLKGSFFTHYLVSGLRGAADENGDRIVTVAEAFRYTHAQTVFASSRTVSGTQHPTFRYDLRGRADLALADLSDVVEHGRLTLPTGATWLIIRVGDSGTMVGEIAADAHRRTLSLRPGEYAVRGRMPHGLLEGRVTVAAGRDTVVDTSKLDLTTYASLVRKGNGKVLGSVSGPFAGVGLMLQRPHTTDGAPYGAPYGAVAGWTWVTPNLTLSPRIAWRHISAKSLTCDVVTLDVRAVHAWELDPLSFDLGFSVGGGKGHGRAICNGYYPNRYYGFGGAGHVQHAHGVMTHIDATLGISWALEGRKYAGAEIALQTWHVWHIFDHGADEIATEIVLNLLLGVWL